VNLFQPAVLYDEPQLTGTLATSDWPYSNPITVTVNQHDAQVMVLCCKTT
jgi:hypothetical protein